MNVRPMERRDLEAWVAMQLELWPDADRAEQLESLEDYFEGGSDFITAAFIAEDNETPLGFLELNLRAYAEGAESSPVPHIEGWFVSEDARRTGVGGALMQAAEQWALANGYHELTSDTTDDYPISPAAHTKLGFVEGDRLITFRKTLNT